MIMSMKDMRISPQEAEDYFFPKASDMPLYPSGLTIRLCSDELEKLGIDYDELCVDDMIHLHGLAVVISKCKNERQNGDPSEEICLQITHLEAEDESDEDEEAETTLDKLYD